jgi:hypothetical protein
MTELTIEVSAEDAKRIVDACKSGKLPGIAIKPPCEHCGLIVTDEMWEQVVLMGTTSFPQCTGECAPQGVIDAREFLK